MIGFSLLNSCSVKPCGTVRWWAVMAVCGGGDEVSPAISIS